MRSVRSDRHIGPKPLHLAARRLGKCTGTDRFASANDFGRRCGSRMRPDSGRPVRSLCAKISGSARPADRQDGLDAERCPHIAGRYRNGAFCRRAESTRKANLQIHRSGRRISARAHRQKPASKVSTLKRLRARPSTLSTRCVVIGWNSLRAMPAKMFSAKG